MFEFFSDLYRFLINRRKFWLIPVLLILIFLGIFLLIGSSGAAGAFIYTIF